MPKVTLTELFKFSPDGMEVIEYEPGEHELCDRAAEIATGLGIAEVKPTGAEKKTKAVAGAKAKDEADANVAADAKAKEDAEAKAKAEADAKGNA